MNNATTRITIARITSIRNLISAITPPSGCSGQAKILSEIANVLETMLAETEDLRYDFEILADYAESLHESLCSIEEDFFSETNGNSSPCQCDQKECICSSCEDCHCEVCLNDAHEGATSNNHIKSRKEDN
ncbi:MAG: hypothetical protein DDT32_01905 [Syntrophomonadaceae bacterium]|nr:hypothetical protein [Bacillota bacterium]